MFSVLLSGLLALSGFIMLSGCDSANREASQPGASDAGQKEEAVLIDESYLLSHTSLTEHDLTDIDTADFIASWNLTAKSLQTLNISACLYAYKKAHGIALQEPETATLLDVPLKVLPQSNVGEITMLLFHMEDASQTQVMFDFTQQKGYSTKNGELVECRGLTEADQASLHEWIVQEDVANWQTEYRGEKKSEWPDRWDLVIVLEDGSTAHYRGDQAAPQGIRSLPNTWCSWFINEEYLLQNTSLELSDLSDVSVAEFVSTQQLTLAIADSNSTSMQGLLAKYRAKASS